MKRRYLPLDEQKRGHPLEPLISGLGDDASPIEVEAAAHEVLLRTRKLDGVSARSSVYEERFHVQGDRNLS